MTLECVNCFNFQDEYYEVVKYFWPRYLHQTVSIEKDGLCQFCRDTKLYVNEEHRNAELEKFLYAAKDEPVVLAFSGGKDSTNTLIQLRVKHNLKVCAVLYDNGFIPDVVKQYAKSICAHLNCEYIELGNESDNYRRFNLMKSFSRKYRDNFSDSLNDICRSCSKVFTQEIYSFMANRSLSILIFGNNSWFESPHTDRSCNHAYATGFRKTKHSTYTFMNVNYPFLAGIKWNQLQGAMREYNFHNTQFTGYTTNCMLSSFQDEVRRRNAHPDLGKKYLSIEIASGFLTKEEARSLLRDDAMPKNEFLAIQRTLESPH